MPNHTKEEDMAERQIKVAPQEDTRKKLMVAHTALWSINLRLHRGDDEFRDEIHRLRDETAILIEAIDASEQADG